MNKLCVANWKMNPSSQKEAEEIASATDKRGVVVCPPFVFLETVRKTIKEASMGAQNCSAEEKGSYTGEVSPFMLGSMGCEYVILGHSERRDHFGENSLQVARKASLAQKAGLVPLICVGEKEESSKEEKEKEIESFLKEQIETSLKGVDPEGVILAYEPIFAIGSGNPCPPELARKRKEFIKSVAPLSLLYGGSVNKENASSYLFESGFEGLLVGGASLHPEEFCQIAKNVQ